MASEPTRASDEAPRAAEGRTSDQVLERLADRIGARAAVQVLFDQPIERGDLIVVPVGRVR